MMSDKSSELKEWYTRRYLPHRQGPGLYQSITYRLADSLPADAMRRIEMELSTAPKDERDITRRQRLEEWLGAGYGSCLLQQPTAAEAVVENWKFYDEKRYDLMAWVVMPNHVHVVIRMYEGFTLGKIVQAWKGYTGKKLSRTREGSMTTELQVACCTPGKNTAPSPQKTDTPEAGATRSSQPIWMREYWDRFIRDDKHLESVVAYIHHNPVKAGLVINAEDWPWSSAQLWKERAEPAGGGLASHGYGENERKERAEPTRGVLASPGNAERLLGCGVGDGDGVGQS